MDESARRRVRKTVTVVFADVTGSTALGERLDPETLQAVLSHYFREMQLVIARHGGTVEKFIGDAVMAVFGVPHVHEDDALRAVRAAVDMRAQLTALNANLDRDHGVALDLRIGVNTGEVVAGDPAEGHSFVAGDAVNVAARLQQTAEPGEIVIGDATRRLVGEAARVEIVEPLRLKGKIERVPAYRLLEVVAGASALRRRTDAPFVGRERELGLLDAALAHAESGCCELVTVLGDPGVGKSRLVAEFLRLASGRTRIVQGRCLPYGEGITYWPLIEIVREIAGPDGARLHELLGDELAVDRLAGAVGLGGSVAPSEEVQWAARKLFEALADARPLVVVLDDVHWAEPTFLDLVEYVGGFSSDFPIVLLCVARPDLLEARPSWTSPRPNAMVLALAPLSEEQAGDLVDGLAGALSSEARERVLEAAEGNPLFVEQLLAHLAEEGTAGSGRGIPPTIEALLAARIDRLESAERSAIECASVEGRGFHRGAVAELVPHEQRASVAPSLVTLVRKELIRPGRSDFPGDDGFRFGHLLIRDAAYGAIPKRSRAELHEHFSAWLERTVGEPATEYEEILGYHLEQAVRYRGELGPLDDAGRQLAQRAASRLASAGERAFQRGDMHAAGNLLRRAVALLEEGTAERADLLIDLGAALQELGELERSDHVLSDALEHAVAAGDVRLEWRARIQRGFGLILSDFTGGVQRAAADATEALPVLGQLDDEAGVAKAWHLLGRIHMMRYQLGDAQTALEQAAQHALHAGEQREASLILAWLADVATFGSVPVEDAILVCTGATERAGSHRATEGIVGGALAMLYAMEGRFADARALIARRRALLEDVGHRLLLAARQAEGYVEMLAGDYEAAEQWFRQGCEDLAEMGETGFLSTTAGHLAHALCAQERYEEARYWSHESERNADAEDLLSQVLWRSARAIALAARDDFEASVSLAREAVEMMARTDSPGFHADSLVALAEVLRLAGRRGEAAAALAEALGLYEQKGHLVGAARAQLALDAFEGEA